MHGLLPTQIFRNVVLDNNEMWVSGLCGFSGMADFSWLCRVSHRWSVHYDRLSIVWLYGNNSLIETYCWTSGTIWHARSYSDLPFSFIRWIFQSRLSVLLLGAPRKVKYMKKPASCSRTVRWQRFHGGCHWCPQIRFTLLAFSTASALKVTLFWITDFFVSISIPWTLAWPGLYAKGIRLWFCPPTFFISSTGWNTNWLFVLRTVTTTNRLIKELPIHRTEVFGSISSAITWATNARSGNTATKCKAKTVGAYRCGLNI